MTGSRAVAEGVHPVHAAPAARPSAGDESCANCGGGPVAAYCAACGQRRMTERDLTVAGVVRDTVHEFTSLDGRLGATLRALLLRPGLLAREYFAGRGSRYMKPLSLFVLLNLVFFLIQPHTGLMPYSYANYTGYDGDVAAGRQDAAAVRAVTLFVVMQFLIVAYKRFLFFATLASL